MIIPVYNSTRLLCPRGDDGQPKLVFLSQCKECIHYKCTVESILIDTDNRETAVLCDSI